MKNLLLPLLLLTVAVSYAQTSNKTTSVSDEYLNTVNRRSEKIVSTLEIVDSAKFYRVRDIIANQYLELNEVDNSKRKAVESLKGGSPAKKPVTESEIMKLETRISLQLDSLHNVYIHSLSKELTADQIEKVKDGMTYGVLPITYKGYQEMLPELTTEQKKTILSMLTEAREKAMDAGSSDEKHKWFGKYKGRINNYLSAQGYNMKKASEEWQARIKAGKSN